MSASFETLSQQWFEESVRQRYSYQFSWLGIPIIQYPQDLVALQEIIWRVQPELIIETGIAHGGSLIYYASLLAMLGKPASVLGIDIDIRDHNRKAIEAHPMYPYIQMIEGSSISPEVIEQVQVIAADKQRVLVILDSMHSHAHVYQELQLYAPLVKAGSYLVVLDTVIEDLPDELSVDRPWQQGNNPKTAVHAFLKDTPRFQIDTELESKLKLSVAPSGYLKCVQ